MNILIVEDDPVSREVLRKIILSLEGYQTAIAASGAEAWALLDDPHRYFDAAFVDITLAGEIDGLQLLQRIRKSELLCSLYVVMCTASADRATVVKSIQFGAQDYLVKPCTSAGVQAKLHHAANYAPLRKLIAAK